MATNLPTLAPITRLSPRVIRILGDNPGKYSLQGTNTYLLGTGAKRILIDTGEGRPAWASSLEKTLQDEKATIDTILLTHWHPDHTGGVNDALRLAPQATVRKYAPTEGQAPIVDGQEFVAEGAVVSALFTPGHTTDHVALILRDEGAMFTGDNVLGHGTAVFEDLGTYMASLARMRDEFPRSGEGYGRAYPGHGKEIEKGRGKVEEYIAHRAKREGEALEVLGRERGDGVEGWESMEVVKVVYKDYPESLHGPAEGSLLAVLRKLEGEGRVREDGGRWKLVGRERL